MGAFHAEVSGAEPRAVSSACAFVLLGGAGSTEVCVLPKLSELQVWGWRGSSGAGCALPGLRCVWASAVLPPWSPSVPLAAAAFPNPRRLVGEALNSRLSRGWYQAGRTRHCPWRWVTTQGGLGKRCTRLSLHPVPVASLSRGDRPPQAPSHLGAGRQTDRCCRLICLLMQQHGSMKWA